jgi:hypothetical protein
MMTNWDLMRDASKLNLPLIGIYNKDIIPTDYRNGFYIINLQDDLDEHGRDLSGTHWTVFYIEDKQAAYFDSFGFKPPIQVQNFLKPFLPYAYSTKIIQNINSGVCGKYVLAFMKFMHNHRHMKSLKSRLVAFTNLFNINPKKNRDILLDYL